MTGRRAWAGAAPLAALVLAALVLAAGLTGCGSETPAAVTAPGQAGTAQPGAGSTSQAGANARVGTFVEVLGARVPAPAARAGQAEVAMTLVNTDPSTNAVLVRASSPAARRAEFTRQGHVIPQISIPVSAGGALVVGPPNPDRLLLTGVHGRLRPGQTVTLILTFARAGQIPLRIPVIG